MFIVHRFRFDHRFFIMMGLSFGVLVGSAFLSMPFPVKSLLMFTVLIPVAQQAYNTDLYKITFITVAVFYLNLISELVVGNLIASIYNDSIVAIINNDTTMYLTQAVAGHVVQLAFAVLTIQYFKRVIFNNPRRYWILLDGVLLLSFLISALFVAVNPALQTMFPPVFILAAVIAFAVINGLVVYMFSQMSKQADMERQIILQEAMAEKTLRDMKENHRLQEEFHRISHEWKNYNAALSFDLSNGDVDSALERIGEAYLSIPDDKADKYTGNEVIDFVLSGKVEMAEKKGIEVDLHCSPVGPVPIDQGDLISVIANLLDNAIEAVTSLDPKYQVIQVDCRCKDDYLLVTVENQYCNELIIEGNRILTSKADMSEHGFGISITRDICEKYNGTLHITHLDGVFIARASFRL